MIKEEEIIIKKAEEARKSLLRNFSCEDRAKFRKDDTLVIVAGGCDKRFEKQIQIYKDLFLIAFKSFKGIIISGGTTAGISGIVGDLPASKDRQMRKISYLPSFIPSWTKLHKAYEVINTDGTDFSAFEAIQNWIDLLASGIDPSAVKLLGVNGGKIASFEYRLALAMGAMVGIIQDSGRAATAIFQDEDWVDCPNLYALPNDPETVKAFVQPVRPSKYLLNEDREIMAMQAHGAYREKQKNRFIVKDPAAADWKNLPHSLKRSNYHQIDHIEEKLRSIGYKIRKVKLNSGTINLKKFKRTEIDNLAEIEHGRWNAERIISGWTLGRRDVNKKKSPYLIPWTDLPEEVREWDRQAVREIPSLLMKQGYEIVPVK